MADHDRDQEKTEQATPRRKDEAREKGQVARSQEIVSVAVLGACLIYFYFASGGAVKKMMSLMVKIFREAAHPNLETGALVPMFVDLAIDAAVIVLPFLLAVAVAGAAANLMQVGFLFSSEAMAPKWDKIDPLRGFQRLFSMKAFVELLKNTLKIAIVGLVAYLTVRGQVQDLPTLMDKDAWQILAYIGQVSFRIMFTTCWVLVLLAILDYGYQRWEYEKGLRMSRQDIKEEYKHTEGDPIVKARIKRMQREAARKRMMAAVPKATVVITNPTHYAVALRYRDGRDAAPVVVAKGRDFVAQKIKEEARKHGVELVENKPLAQALYLYCDVGDSIPKDMYKAVAEVLAYVYRLKHPRRERAAAK